VDVNGNELASGTLTLTGASGTAVLGSGLSGSIDFDTLGLANGAYTLTYTESALGAVTTSHSVALAIDNSPTGTTSPLAPHAGGASAWFAALGSLVTSELMLLVEVGAVLAVAVGLYGRRRGRGGASRGERGPEESRR
jgi:hypothetical protein